MGVPAMGIDTGYNAVMVSIKRTVEKCHDERREDITQELVRRKN